MHRSMSYQFAPFQRMFQQESPLQSLEGAALPRKYGKSQIRVPLSAAELDFRTPHKRTLRRPDSAESSEIRHCPTARTSEIDSDVFLGGRQWHTAADASGNPDNRHSKCKKRK
jgi:hypothetical protein